ncbi:MAG: homoserine O-acetyltransferase [Bacteroidota bacterium]|jgi:homoserine O-acetyltransferase
MNIFNTHQAFTLESGEQLDNLQIAYHTYGTFDSTKNNVVWVTHALTANSDVFDWWNGVFGENDLFNPEEHFIVCANILGSHYGTSGPLNTFKNDEPLLDYFPFVTTRDMARAHDLLREHLGIEKINLLVGASLGGQQALEWAIEQNNRIENLILIATNARHSAFGIAFNETQRLALFADQTFGNGNVDGGRNGLISARAIAMLSYRSYDGYAKTQTNPGNHTTDNFLAASYQHYQGEKLAKRFNAYSYLILSKAMDAHNVGRKRPSVEIALQQIKARTLVIGIESDLLFPISEQAYLSEWIPNSFFGKIDSEFGHDGFLVENTQLTNLISDFLYNDFKGNRPTIFKTTTKKVVA